MTTDLLATLGIDEATIDQMNQALAGGEGIQLPFPAVYLWATSGKRNMKQLGGVSYFGGWSTDAFKLEEMAESGDLCVSLDKLGLRKAERSGEHGDYAVYETREIIVSPIARRESWTNEERGSRSPVYDPINSRSHLQVLALLGAVVESEVYYVAPAVLTAKGMQSSRVKSALGEWAKAVQPFAKGLNVKKVPLSSLWITLGTRGTEPTFEEVGKRTTNTITPIRALIKPDMELADITKHIVGSANFAISRDLLQQAHEWLNAWKEPTANGDAAPEMPEPEF